MNSCKRTFQPKYRIPSVGYVTDRFTSESRRGGFGKSICVRAAERLAEMADSVVFPRWGRSDIPLRAPTVIYFPREKKRSLSENDKWGEAGAAGEGAICWWRGGGTKAISMDIGCSVGLHYSTIAKRVTAAVRECIAPWFICTYYTPISCPPPPRRRRRRRTVYWRRWKTLVSKRRQACVCKFLILGVAY